MNAERKGRLGGRLWFSIVFFGLIGQIAWVVENMYFATLSQDIFANSGRQDLSYIVTTLMVIFSAVTATVTTVFAGGLCDRCGKRRPFIAYGYMLWGVTIAAFGLIPMRAEGRMIAVVAALLVIFDCLMTLCGSTANDAAFNAWVTDVTTPQNRGKVDAVLSMLPVFAVVIIFIGLGSFYSAENQNNLLFFAILGAIPLLSGVLARFLLKDAPTLQKSTDSHYLRDTFYGFRPSVVRENKMMYVCLTAACVVGVSQQTFFSYLMNFVIRTLGYGDGFILPVAVIIVGAAAFTGVCGVLFDRFGRKHFYLPLLALVVIGTFSMYLLKIISGPVGTVILYVGGVLMMGAILSLTGALTAAFRDYTPVGYEGRFQGVRMCFVVLIPMIVGPLISMVIGLDAMGLNGADFAPTFEIFLAASIVAAPAVLPILFVRRDDDRLREKM
ncbi:MAG: MFS transporter [Clostridia bacterium]|nr:MFS transporter [Clostridia bacterium]